MHAVHGLCCISTMRVLVVDDFPYAAQASCNLFELFGHEARLALTGRDALLVYISFEPDIIVIDLDLPDRDGADVAREIRATPRGARVFLAALIGSEVTERGSPPRLFDYHLIKPASAQKLRAVVDAARSGYGIA